MENSFLLSALYRFSITVQSENSRLCRRYIREVSVSQLNFKSESTKFQLLCKKYSFDDPQITAFIRKTAYVFDVLIVIIAADGSIADVENEKELQQKWELLKEELLIDHAGIEFENYLHNVDSTIYDKEKLIAFLESDEMYGVFFKGLWLCDIIDNQPQYEIQRIKNTVKLTERAASELQSEQYIFQESDLIECLKINNNIQYEILCLGLKKY